MGSLLPLPPYFLHTSWLPVQTNTDGVCHSHCSTTVCVSHTKKDNGAWRQWCVPSGHRSTAAQWRAWCSAAGGLHRWTNYHHSVADFFFYPLAAQDHHTEAIKAICCTAHARSDYRDTSAARSAGAQSGCNNQQPAQTRPRWTGLPFLISFPPPASEQTSFCASVK